MTAFAFTGCEKHPITPATGTACRTCHFIAGLLAEREEARSWVRRMTAKNSLTCVYCGEAYPPGSPTHGASVLTEHIKTCTKHPLRAAEARVAEAERERDRREALLTLYRVKLAVDGLNGRPWDSTTHLAAVEALGAAGEKPLPVDSYESLVILREMVECSNEALTQLEKGTATPGAAVAEPADGPPPSASSHSTSGHGHA